MQVTRLWHIEANGKRRLMNTIEPSSRFHSFKAPPDLWKVEQQKLCAEMIRDGWILNGQLGGSWIIEPGENDPRELSKTVREMLS